jgi:hypothetical protein
MVVSEGESPDDALTRLAVLWGARRLDAETLMLPSGMEVVVESADLDGWDLTVDFFGESDEALLLGADLSGAFSAVSSPDWV